MPSTVWIFDLEKMVDNAGIGKEIILLQQSALFVILDYFQLSSYRLWVCWRLTTWLAAPSSTLKPGALKAQRTASLKGLSGPELRCIPGLK